MTDKPLLRKDKWMEKMKGHQCKWCGSGDTWIIQTCRYWTTRGCANCGKVSKVKEVKP